MYVFAFQGFVQHLQLDANDLKSAAMATASTATATVSLQSEHATEGYVIHVNMQGCELNVTVCLGLHLHPCTCTCAPHNGLLHVCNDLKLNVYLRCMYM